MEYVITETHLVPTGCPFCVSLFWPPLKFRGTLCSLTSSLLVYSVRCLCYIAVISRKVDIDKWFLDISVHRVWVTEERTERTERWRCRQEDDRHRYQILAAILMTRRHRHRYQILAAILMTRRHRHIYQILAAILRTRGWQTHIRYLLQF